jgi:hypothetical protein
MLNHYRKRFIAKPILPLLTMEVVNGNSIFRSTVSGSDQELIQEAWAVYSTKDLRISSFGWVTIADADVLFF